MDRPGGKHNCLDRPGGITLKENTMTRVQFLAYIKRQFKRTDKDTEIYEALNETIQDIGSRYSFSGYNFQSWVPTVIAQEDYPLPTNLLQLSHPIRLLEGSATGDSGYPLDFITKEEYDEKEPNPNRTSPATGKPSKYTIYSDSILLTPIPDKTSYLLEINWGKIPTTLSVDADTPSLIATWDEILKWGTLMRLYYGLGLYQEGKVWDDLYESDEKGIPKMIRIEKDKKREMIGQIKNNSL